MYNSIIKYKWDDKNVLDYAIQEAKLEGERKGELKGKLEALRDVALELKKEGLSIEFIAKTTSLSIEEIEKL